MALQGTNQEKLSLVLQQEPHVTIFLRPIAPPAALGLAGFAGSTFITASWMANWWGDADSPTIFFPFVAFWGGLAQFIAGIKGYEARDTLVTVINTMWGSFWMSIGLLYLLVATGTIPAHSVKTHFPELASWFVVLAFFTWAGAFAAFARDLALFLTLTFLAIGSTIACSLFAFSEPGVGHAVKAAAYFFIFSSLTAWWRVTVYLVEEAYGPKSMISKFFPVFRLPIEKGSALIVPGLGEPGVKRGMPGVI